MYEKNGSAEVRRATKLHTYVKWYKRPTCLEFVIDISSRVRTYSGFSLPLFLCPLWCDSLKKHVYEWLNEWSLYDPLLRALNTKYQNCQDRVAIQFLLYNALLMRFHLFLEIRSLKEGSIQIPTYQWFDIQILRRAQHIALLLVPCPL